MEDIEAGFTERVLSFFKETEKGLISPELEEYREKNRLRNLKKSEGGKKGAERKRYMASKGLGYVQGTPGGTPKGSLIQSKLNQSNIPQPNQDKSIKKEFLPVKDYFEDISFGDDNLENEPEPF